MIGLTGASKLEFIGEIAFYKCVKLQEFTIPPLVRTLSPATFEFCEALKIVKLHDGLTKIGGECFAVCSSLEHVVGLTGASKLEIIRDKAFHTR